MKKLTSALLIVECVTICFAIIEYAVISAHQQQFPSLDDIGYELIGVLLLLVTAGLAAVSAVAGVVVGFAIQSEAGHRTARALLWLSILILVTLAATASTFRLPK